jgi:heme/copper-type cytochrome/quinol oxidase subunit 4
MEAAPRPSHPAKLIGLALVGAAVAVALGVYGNVHDPTGRSILGDGLVFSGTLNMKAWLATIVVGLALVQIVSALRMYGRIGSGEAPRWVARTHRVSGTLAFLVSLPVVYHCLWALGFQDTDTRVLVHSLAGCFFYGAFTTKMLSLRSDQLPGWALPALGGSVFTALVAIWLTSSLWFFDNVGFPEF